ncbi:hypothetical protein [Niabella hibiscisoli]|uniref:hypothetical protein n=1 Tax=Niabella hibiscisoli TaxID=1825928 RepID=UPI001F106734|nr:hypothetical protein [Niabella hibiscisoli]MCH5718207.1 hypothetical protein [Niabella hibiscisoli]
MQKAKHPSLPEHLLSQLVQKYQFHPHALNLKKVVKDLFDENPPQELAIAIDQFCMAV